MAAIPPQGLQTGHPIMIGRVGRPAHGRRTGSSSTTSRQALSSSISGVRVDPVNPQAAVAVTAWSLRCKPRTQWESPTIMIGHVGGWTRGQRLGHKPEALFVA